MFKLVISQLSLLPLLFEGKRIGACSHFCSIFIFIIIHKIHTLRTLFASIYKIKSAQLQESNMFTSHDSRQKSKWLLVTQKCELGGTSAKIISKTVLFKITIISLPFTPILFASFSVQGEILFFYLLSPYLSPVIRSGEQSL